MHEESVIPTEDMVRHLLRYFSLFHEGGRKSGEGRCADNVQRKSDGGRFTLREDRTVSVLKWSPDD
ncbi:MAG: hypothetical protein MZU84_00720 [Sphingobacterium sp.]|nr:hypothetical protein [Sphingobacterium sp.]